MEDSRKTSLKAKVKFLSENYLKPQINNFIGTYKYEDGRRYKGEYHQNKRHCFGTFTWANGKIYEGHWVNGKQHGGAQ